MRAHEILLRKIHDMTFFEYMVRTDDTGKSKFQLQCDHMLQLSVSPLIVDGERVFKERNENKKGSFPIDGKIKLQTISRQDLTKSHKGKLSAIKLGEFGWEMGFPLREAASHMDAYYEAISAQEAEKRGVPYTAYCYYHSKSDIYVITSTDTPLEIFKTACRINFHLQIQSRVIRQHYQGSANPCDLDFFLTSDYTASTMVSGIYEKLRSRMIEMKTCIYKGDALFNLPSGTPMDLYVEPEREEDTSDKGGNETGEGEDTANVPPSVKSGATEVEGCDEVDKQQEATNTTLRPRQSQIR